MHEAAIRTMSKNSHINLRMFWSRALSLLFRAGNRVWSPSFVYYEGDVRYCCACRRNCSRNQRQIQVQYGYKPSPITSQMVKNTSHHERESPRDCLVSLAELITDNKHNQFCTHSRALLPDVMAPRFYANQPRTEVRVCRLNPSLFSPAPPTGRHFFVKPCFTQF